MSNEIIEIIETLPTRQNMAIHLVICEKRSQTDAARIMHITQPCLYRLLHRAYRTLRRELSE